MQKGVTTSVYCKNTNPVPVDQYGVPRFQSKCDGANNIDSDVIARKDHHVPDNLDSLPGKLVTTRCETALSCCSQCDLIVAAKLDLDSKWRSNW
jgi:hypothetical protein